MWGNMFLKNDNFVFFFLGFFVYVVFHLFPVNGLSDDNLAETKLYEDVCSECRFQNGQGFLTFFGLKLYKATLVSETDYGDIFDSKFALQIQYLRKFKGEDIAKRSVKEMAKLGLVPEDVKLVWYDWMYENIPDVKKNDILTGVYIPKQGIELYFNGVQIASNKNTSLAESFFLIWLHNRTSEPKLKSKLLQHRKNG